LVTGADRPFSEDEHVFWTGSPPTVPCSHIQCRRCKELVRHVDHRKAAVSESDADKETLYATANPEESALLSSVGNQAFRLYFCRCEWASVGGANFLDNSDQPWGCAGHADVDGSWAVRIRRRSERFVAAMKDDAAASKAWEALAAEPVADPLMLYRQLMNTTQSALVRGRAAMAIGALSGDHSDAKSVLTATVNNSDDTAAKAEAQTLLAQLPA